MLHCWESQPAFPSRSGIDACFGVRIPRGKEVTCGPRHPAGLDAPYGVRTPRGTEATCGPRHPAGFDAPYGVRTPRGREATCGPRHPAGFDAPYGVRTPRGTDATCGPVYPAGVDAPYGVKTPRGTEATCGPGCPAGVNHPWEDTCYWEERLIGARLQMVRARLIWVPRHFRRAFRSRLYRRRWTFSPTVIALHLQILSTSFSEETPTKFFRGLAK
ncbi:putative proline-glycine rich protein [Aspergillus fumigatus Af293]|uniref:Proline-glycine rich protein, putative n=2 Tax=Aspergillus fumigatus TaxID=746128 RepID=Q4WMM6_ASPFU|nr:proline-glycine rich protein, putative [Aspergillus fumigatus Af293]EAL88788.1 proline-glycine rich protein, putative [Aspergillus fumigatus Af293]EDP48553.1 proline-glycine rich protein, putative [Aspergillus fumigatus A1163]